MQPQDSYYQNDGDHHYLETINYYVLLDKFN